ncbi:MAG: hypothetical protein M1836_002168 [Candelina mexicana]|nr:MAG: hypothetical protein M1836_002168 [Candelina mexicana]
MYAAYIYRLMTQKLPKEISRPSMFVSVGPAGFTATALIIVAKSTTQAFPDKFMGDGTMAAMISKVMANWFGICLWGLALWFFFISLFSNAAMLTSSNSKFTITWWSFVFPNTALVTATFAVGDAFNSHHLKIIGCVLTCILICVWGFTMAMMIRAIYIGEILMPQKGEDRDEGGWKEEHATRQLGSKTREEARKKRQEKNEGRRGRRWRNQEKDEEEGHA